MLTMEKFEEAYNTVQKVVNQTSLIYSDFFSEISGNKVYFKPENLQVTGAYKIRGAYYKIFYTETYMMNPVSMHWN